MSTKIEYEDGSVYFEPEPSETEDLEYVYLLCDDYENGGHIRTVSSTACATD